MFRMRRYRVFIIFAIIAVGALYHFTSLGDLESAGAASVEGLKNFGQKVESSVPPTISKPDVKDPSEPKDLNAPIAAPSLADSGQAAKQSKGPAIVKKPDVSSEQSQVPAIASQAPAIARKPNEPAQPSTAAESLAKDDKDVVNPKATPAGKPAPPISSTSINKTSKPHTGPADPIDDQKGGRLEIIADTSIPKIHWSQMPEHFPVPTELLIQLPTGKPKAIPKIQHEFPAESSEEEAAREKKREVIKEAFSFSWAGYKEKAWMQDELSPLSGKYRNPFCAWGATLVDSLDTLYMMGLKDEFEEAVEAVKDIDFTTSSRNDIPLFETVIRYLGGLVAAYDISDGAHRILLDKAVELADILIGAFDTPNRMPMTFYLWKPTFASQPHRAKTRVVLAELGSLSLEFTRLAQITKEDKYYDAIARITNEFEIWQNNTRLPGLWPMNVDASGCKKPAVSPQTTYDHTAMNGATNSKPLGIHDSEVAKTPNVLDGGSTHKAIPEDLETRNPSGPSTSDEIAKGSSPGPFGAVPPKVGDGLEIEKTPARTSQTLPAADPQGASAGATGAVPASPATNFKGALGKREINDGTGLEPQQGTTSKPPECEPQGLASPPFTTSEQFGIGGQADSTYEYLPKEYMLLGGLVDQYRTVYEAAANTITKKLLYRAMIPDMKRRTLHPGLAKVSDMNNAGGMTPEGSHLGCFAGGMYAVGAKIFGREGDMKIAKELTDGCVWAYKATTTGIMPESFLLVPCPDPAECPWNETYYHEKLDPYEDSREKTRLAQISAQQVVLTAAKETEGATSPVENIPALVSSTPKKLESQPAEAKADGEVAPAQPKVDKDMFPSTEGIVGKLAPSSVEQSAEQPVSLPAGGAHAEHPMSAPAGDDVLPKSRIKRQLGDIAPLAAAVPLDVVKDTPAASLPEESAKKSTITPIMEVTQEPAADKMTTGPPLTKMQQNDTPLSKNATNGTLAAAHPVPQAFPYTPALIPTHKEFVQARIRDERLPKGMTKVTGARYLLR